MASLWKVDNADEPSRALSSPIHDAIRDAIRDASQRRRDAAPGPAQPLEPRRRAVQRQAGSRPSHCEAAVGAVGANHMRGQWCGPV